ncbi:hypothetical protein LMG29542_07592 [Paraburkholderia humisilvae]|uniref:SET domain-containing protein n=1 Tax=Paraburkholderia humisilvae TaxID=627669 RepID=A0A6J5F6X6_9BURK|nr:hypothetical protein LMG29542_07592 [Paraburkholderia humisilvae]
MAGDGRWQQCSLSQPCMSPNCEAVETDGHVFIHAFTAIKPGDELFIDYGLAVDGEITEDIQTRYLSHCGASTCRRSMLRHSARLP